MRRSIRVFTAVTILVSAALGVGCTATKQRKPTLNEELQGFLGDTYRELEPGAPGQLAFRYETPGVDWSQYNTVILEPVQFWAGGDSKIPPDVQQMLSTYFYNSLKTNLEKHNANLTDVPGPRVIRLQVALVDATSATPVLRTVSLIVPQARVLNQAQELVTGSYGFSGSAEVAMKATNAKTGQLLAAAVDRRSGGGSPTQAVQWKWGDVKAIIDVWTQRCADRLAELRAQAPPRP
jgi:hypothetical protein